MISIVQSYNFNNKIVDIDLAKVPNLSNRSKDILTALGTNLPQSFQTAAPLIDRVHSMEETKEMLREAQVDSGRDKAIAFLKAAMLVALVAGMIIAPFVLASLDVVLLPIGFVAYLGLSGFLYMDSCEKIENIEKRLPDYSSPWYSTSRWNGTDLRGALPALGGGLILPLFEAFTHQSRLERVLQKQSEFIDTTMAGYQKQNNQLLPIAYQFYKDHSPALLEALDRKIEQSQQSLIAMKQLPERVEIGENEMQARIDTYQRTKDELITIAGFYQQFDPD